MRGKTIRIAAISGLAGLTLALGAGQVLAGSQRPTTPEAPAARNTGPAVSCVQLTRLRDSHIRNDRTIDFIESGRKGWRVTLPYSCPGLRSADAFSYKTSLSQLCSNDIIHVLHPVGSGLEQGAGCGLGKFQPIELVK